MRLLQAIAGGEFGGAELHFVRLAVALNKAGIEQRILTRPISPERDATLESAGLEAVYAPFGGRLDLTTPKIFKREIEAFRPDIALTYMSRASAKCPKGDFVHIGRLGGYYNLKYYRHCDHLVGITPDIVEYLRSEGWPADRAHCIPNFVEDVAGADPLDRAAFDTPEDAPLVMTLGRLHEDKAFDILLEAIARIPSVYLWLAGEGPLERTLKRQAETLGITDRVRFLGWHHDTAPLFAAVDLYIVPSRFEPLGSVVLEGWMHGLPMVAAASQGPSYLVSHEKDGLLVPVDDTAKLTEAMQRLLTDQDFARRIALAGRAKFEAEFTEPVAVARYLELFDRVLSERSD